MQVFSCLLLVVLFLLCRWFQLTLSSSSSMAIRDDPSLTISRYKNLFYLAPALFSTVAAFQATNTSPLLLRIENQQYTRCRMSTEDSIDDIYALMDTHGKVNPTSSASEFLAALLLGVPVWLTVVLPLSVIHQVGLALTKPIRSTPDFSFDTGTQVAPSEIVPHEKRKYDVVVLGATGFTGKLVAEYIAKTYGVGKEVKWAIAGRTKSKLEQVKKDIAEQLGNAKVLDIDTLIVDTNVVTDLPTLVKDARAVITTAGPFQKHGSTVVEFCAKYGTHYVDITGESDWVKTMILQWDATAQKTGAKIISMCGHDSIPWDLTVMKLEEALPDGEELVSAECLDEVAGAISGGTANTIMMSTDGSGIPSPKFAYDPFLKLPNGSKSTSTSAHQPPLFVRKSTPINRHIASTYSSLFIMSVVNAEIVKRSVALRQKSKNVTYREFQVFPDFKTAFCNQFGIIAFVTALFSPISCYLLKFVLPRAGEGPSREAMEKGFLAISAEGVGSKGTKVQSLMYFSRDAGYLDTARMVAESGLTLALDSNKLSPGGGFFTPSVGMSNVLLDRLCRTGTSFALSVKP